MKSSGDIITSLCFYMRDGVFLVNVKLNEWRMCQFPYQTGKKGFDVGKGSPYPK